MKPCSHTLFATALSGLLLGWGGLVAADEPFPPHIDPELLAQHIRTTEPQTAEDELASLFVPDGFRIDLVASEPAISKPMNLAFDDRGRLWVSHSVEYPFPAPADRPPRDRISVIEDVDGDGIPETATVFADGLNIPIGLCPWGKGVICFSIPDILYLRDTDQDGRADQREVLYGPFDTTRDTHGMCNAFRRGQDGWIYACHGFNNQSTVSGSDGHTITMKSGNVFRFRPDGSRIEHFTYGQVNPFGMAIDRFGDLFTADCHTKPVTLLLEGGCYDSFGRPHDGLGYVPSVMDHLHGSTAIGGIALGESLAFPDPWQESTFGGNVMTSRVNCNRLVRRGGSVRAVEATDFLVSADPWFRPVDLIAGPDGALYVADFYNRIIGHYEVDLHHPGRDRHRGRIWRVACTDPDATADWRVSGTAAEIADGDLETLITGLNARGSVQGQLVMDRLADDFPAAAVPLLRESLSHTSPTVRWRSLRVLQRLDAVRLDDLQKAVRDPDPVVRTHAFRALALRPADARPTAEQQQVTALLATGILDTHGIVQRAAVLAAAHHPADPLVSVLTGAWHSAPPHDVHLRHAIRMTLRDLLQDERRFARLAPAVDRANLVLVAELCPAIGTTPAAEFIAEHVTALTESSANLPVLLQFAARQAPPESAGQLIASIRSIHANDTDQQRALLSAMTPTGSNGPPAVRSAIADWATALTCELLQVASPDDISGLQQRTSLRWTYHPHATRPDAENCWGITERRRSADGVDGAPLHSSFEAGESRTGILQSEPFLIPDELTFFVAGHDGNPQHPPGGLNVVRLRDAESLNVLRVAAAPRNDVAQPVTWDLREFAGRSGRIELVDGDQGGAYAWLAVGRFSLPELNPDRTRLRHRTAAALIAEHQLRGFQPLLEHLLVQPGTDPASLALYSGALAALRGDARLQALALLPQFSRQSPAVIRQAVTAIVENTPAAADPVLRESLKTASLLEQQQLSEVLSVSAEGSRLLVELLDAGVVSMQVLFHAPTRNKLLVTLDKPVQQRLAERLARLPSEEEQLTSVINRTRQAYLQNPGVPERGAEVFTRHCSACHQVAGQGKRIGPNLDGIGNRGLDRLTEDILAPNRNVDAAFRSSTVVLADGRTLTGLLRDAADGSMELVDGKGDVTTIPADRIDERIPSLLSPMPSNVQQLLNEQQLRDLLAWLLQQRK